MKSARNNDNDNNNEQEAQPQRPKPGQSGLPQSYDENDDNDVKNGFETPSLPAVAVAAKENNDVRVANNKDGSCGDHFGAASSTRNVDVEKENANEGNDNGDNGKGTLPEFHVAANNDRDHGEPEAGEDKVISSGNQMVENKVEAEGGAVVDFPPQHETGKEICQNEKLSLEEGNSAQKDEENIHVASDCQTNLAEDGGNDEEETESPATEAAPVKLPPPGRSCRYSNCTRYKKSKSDGYCQMHFKLYGRPLNEIEAVPKAVAPLGRGCRTEGCSKYRKAKCDGYCLTCYRNSGDGNIVDGTATAVGVTIEEGPLTNQIGDKLCGGETYDSSTFHERIVPLLLHGKVASHDDEAPTAAAPVLSLDNLGNEMLKNQITVNEAEEGAKIKGTNTTATLPEVMMDYAAENCNMKPFTSGLPVDEEMPRPILPLVQDDAANKTKQNPSTNNHKPTALKKNGKLCNFEDCTKYKQSGCCGYCLTHVKLADPNQYHLDKQLKSLNSSIKKRTNKRYLCKWNGCEKYIQSNCHGYCLTHVKFANYEEEDGADVTKVRVRVMQRLQNGFCQAFLSESIRKSWGFTVELDNNAGAGHCGEDSDSGGEMKIAGEDNKEKPRAMKPSVEGEDNVDAKDSKSMMEADPAPHDRKDKEVDRPTPVSPSAMDVERHENNGEKQLRSQTQPSPIILDFEIASSPHRKSNGATKCKAVGCPKNSQSHSQGFCRSHHNRYLICTGQCTSWDCLCGEKIASFRDRCGVCHRWRGGRQSVSKRYANESQLSKDDEKVPLSGKRQRKPSDKAAVAGPPWECTKCRISNPRSKRRCGGCLAWKGTAGGTGACHKKSTIIGKEESARTGLAAGGNNNVKFSAFVPGRILGGKMCWECKKCNFENFQSELQCFMCQAMRPNWQWLKSRRMSTNYPATTETQTPQGLAVTTTKHDRKATSSNSTDNFDGYHAHPTSSSTTENSGKNNYYGNCCDWMSYANVSIHYDFNQAYYSNHDYSYLNNGINSKSGQFSSGDKDV